MESISKPSKDEYFVLDKTYTRAEVRGLIPYNYVIGLRAGTYSSVGEDRDGRYFQGEGDCVIQLGTERADHFLKSGEIPRAMAGFPGGEGGIWLPRVGSNSPPRLWYKIRNKGLDTMQIVPFLVVNATEGSFGWVPLENDAALLAEIKVRER
ncbi:hypothetical protein [Variovorax sp. YR634]|uniref:hypothetical protein n=1 Tax=Variovorax sp. YR634 TaxID=1884385 RepID=UPI00115F9001|nr:hypothetical protein [Variovorax sp. YR634]